MRKLFDRILRAAIKLCMLTGVTFLVTACYGPAPDAKSFGKQYEKDRQELEQRLAQAAQEKVKETLEKTQIPVTNNQ